MAITKLPRSGIKDNAINASKIEDGTVAAAEISGTVSAAKLNSTLDISGKTVTLPNTSVTSGMLANTTIANAKLANSTFTIRGTSRALGASFNLGIDVDWQSVVVSDGSTVTTMVAGRGYFVNNTSAAGIVKLPASAVIGDTIAIKDYAGNFGTNNLLIQRNGHNIQGVTNDSSLETNRAAVVLVYVDATKGWLYQKESNVADLQAANFTSATGGTVSDSGDFRTHTFTGDGNFVVSQIGNAPVPGAGPAVVDYLVVAGGGGSSLGGGGAGGYRESHTDAISGPYTASPLATPTGITLTVQTYPITVGAGGAGHPGQTSGVDSVFSTITSTGGGKGNWYFCAGTPGGSGGGGAYNGPGTAAGSGNTPPVSPPQGNNGGTGNAAASPSNAGGAGGGGGAGAAGQNGANNDPGNGGNGVATEITGSSVTRAGGGGAGGFSAPGGSAGSGGGGNGGTGPNGTGGSQPGSNGTANTGGGGGGSGRDGVGGMGTGGTGGKGLVVIKYKYK